jgi:hypothetical protein
MCSKWNNKDASKGVGYMDVVEALLPYGNDNQSISASFRSRKKYFMLQNITQSKNIYYK